MLTKSIITYQQTIRYETNLKLDESIFFVILKFYFHPLECTHLLLAHGAPVKVKNIQGWSPLAEAISYGDRQTSKDVTFTCESLF